MFLLGVLLLAVAWAATANPSRPESSLSKQRFWVFFSDKCDQGSSIGTPSDKVFSEKATVRRAKIGKAALDYYDVPVCPQYIEEIESRGLSVRYSSRWLNAVSVSGDEVALRSLAGLPFVRRIRPVLTLRRKPVEATARFGRLDLPKMGDTPPFDYGPSFAQLDQIGVVALHQLGLSGESVLIGICDTGYDLDHPAFDDMITSGRLLAARDFIDGDEDVTDGPAAQLTHGTYTLSAMAGFDSGNLVGAAYGADLVLAKTEIVAEEIQVEEDNWVAALEWFDSLGVDIVSSSLGYIDWYTVGDLDGNTAVTTVAADMAASRGMLVVNAAGNEATSPWKKVITPADGDSVLAVGAVDSSGTRVSFSSMGPTADGRIKPDVMALGSGTWSAEPGTGYSAHSGTSLATPLVAGAAALLLESDPSLAPVDLLDILRNSAGRASNPDTLYGYGIVNALEAAGMGFAYDRESDRFFYNYPNPFSGSTTIQFLLTEKGLVHLKIFSLGGELVKSIAVPESDQSVGLNSVEWNGTNQGNGPVAPGVYLCRLETGTYAATAKLVVAR